MQLLSLRRLAITTSAIALAASTALAQTSGAPTAKQYGTIDGFVSDTSLTPLHAAFVSILGTSIRIGTGPNGRFRITHIPAGEYLVIVKRVGYRPTSGVVEVPASDTVRLSYTLQTAPVELSAVVTTEKVQSDRMKGFQARKALGVGHFMTQDEIQARNSVYPTELFRAFQEINVSPNRQSVNTEYYALSAREGGNPSVGACPMQVVLDEVPLPTPFNLDLLPPPRDLAGIEVYAGAATIPEQFNGYNRGCGVIVVWTKDGY